MNLNPPTLIPYFTAGWPQEDSFVEAVTGAAEAGCDLFEVGFPFSDPVADGPVIQKTSAEALAGGVNYKKSLELTTRATETAGIPAVVMTYANLVYHRGVETFCSEIAQAGAVGIIVPDLPLEEAEELLAAAGDHGLCLVQLCAPTTPEARAQRLASASRGFLYLVSVKGVTGDRKELPAELGDMVARAKKHSQVPVCVGFGISTPEQAGLVCRHADGVIVGSALLRHLEGCEVGEARARSRDFLGAMLSEMRQVRSRPSG